MATIKINEQEKANLESLLEKGYQELKKYVESPGSTTLSQVNLFYHPAYRLLAATCSPATHSFRYLRKGGERAKEIEGYIYQAVLMVNPPSMKSNVPPLQIESGPKDWMGGLKAYIDAVEPPSPGPRGGVFRETQIKAAQVREAGRFDDLFRTMTYIRNQYPNGAIRPSP